MANLTVDFGVQFKREFAHFPVRDQDAISDFIEHLLVSGFEELEGRNKKSDEVPHNDPQWRFKVAYAQEHSLWHYHIGIIQYDMTKPFGDRTSEYVVHYQYLDNLVKIVDYSAHPPLNLPSDTYLR
ncbi:hypothetical protein A4G18_01515 [Pasteurellaceae bacterium Pebbles2]|nr:hypothetical protein [Pasteurellaceae bacterium Pebbles2]